MKSFVRDRKDRVVPASLRESFPPGPAGSHRDAGLNLLIPGAARVLRRVQEGRDALLLIILERELIGDRDRQQSNEREHAQEPHRHAGHERHRECHGNERRRRAEIRLPGDDEEWNSRDRADHDEVDVRDDPAAAFAEELGKKRERRFTNSEAGGGMNEIDKDATRRGSLEKQDVQQQRDMPM